MQAFESREALADAAADALSERLSSGGLLIVAGGSTPAPTYERLSRRRLPWAKITVTLTDERFVELASDDSNEGMVRARLLTGEAVKASFLSLNRGGESPDADARAVEALLAPRLPAAAVLLGMGADGHVASLFPETPELAAGLDLDGERAALGVARPGLTPFVPRVTLTARALTQTSLMVLLITGDEKRALVERIERDGAYGPPAATFLRQDRCPVRVLWTA
jgi:6-phosphogluconolactonase